MRDIVWWLSKYLNCIRRCKTRYHKDKEKLAILGGITDPYLTKGQSQNGLEYEWQDWPEVQYHFWQKMMTYKSLDNHSMHIIITTSFFSSNPCFCMRKFKQRTFLLKKWGVARYMFSSIGPHQLGLLFPHWNFHPRLVLHISKDCLTDKDR